MFSAGVKWAISVLVSVRWTARSIGAVEVVRGKKDGAPRRGGHQLFGNSPRVNISCAKVVCESRADNFCAGNVNSEGVAKQFGSLLLSSSKFNACDIDISKAGANPIPISSILTLCSTNYSYHLSTLCVPALCARLRGRGTRILATSRTQVERGAHMKPEDNIGMIGALDPKPQRCGLSHVIGKRSNEHVKR